jgi:AsmA-like protein
MKKFLKIFGYTFLVLILLIIALPFMFKGKIVEMVKEETNAMLNAKVDFGEFDMGLISTFPNFNFEIENVKVEGVDKFEGVMLADIKNLSLKVDLMSVISGDEINIKSIHITEPRIIAMVLADTTANWDIVKATGEVVEEEVTEESASAFKLGLKDVTITNGYVLYKDETMDLFTEIKGLNFNMNGDMTADVTNLNTHTTIDEFNLGMEGIDYMKKAIIVADADLEADLLNSKYTFKENEFKINELILGMDGWLAMPADDIDMELTFGAKKTAFKNILSLVPAVYMTDFSSVKTDGKLALDGHAKGTYSETKMPAFGLNLVVEKAMFKYPDLPKSVNNINIDLHVTNPDGDLDHTIVDLKTFHMEMAGNPIDANLYVKTPISDADIKAGLKADFSLASLQDVMPLEGDQLEGDIKSDLSVAGKMSAIEQERYQDFHAEGSFSIANMNYKSDSLPYDVYLNILTLNFSPQFVELAQFDSKIGKTDIQANGRIDNIISYVFSDDEELTGTFNVNSTLLDLNEFMSEEEVASTEESTSVEEEPLAVVEVPKNINFTLKSTFKKVIYDNIEIDDMNGLLTVKNQKVSMDNLDMKLLDGAMIMDGYYETTNPVEPSFKFDMDIKDFDVEKVATTFNSITEMAPIVKNCKGKFGTKLAINGVFNEQMEPNLNTLNGNGNMKTKNMQVVDFKAMNKLADALKNEKLRKIDINDVNISYQIKDGRVYTDPFDVKMGNTKGKMSGSSGIDQTIDYKMALKIPSKDLGVSAAMDKMNAQASGLGLDLKAAETVDVDVLIGGTFTEPKISTSLKGMANSMVDNVKEQIKEKINEEVDKAKDKAIEEAKKQAQNLKDEAKKQADKIRSEGKKAADDVRAKANAEADKLKNKGGNFIEKKANEIAAKKLAEEGEKQAQKVEAEANKKANDVEAKAQQESDKLVADAEAKIKK